MRVTTARKKPRLFNALNKLSIHGTRNKEVPQMTEKKQPIYVTLDGNETAKSNQRDLTRFFQNRHSKNPF